MFRPARLGGLAALAISTSQALPLTSAEITRLCGEAEGLTHCGRLVEAEQLKRIPGLAMRDGSALRITLFPSGQVTFMDVDTASGGSSFSLWDHFNAINASLVFATRDDDASFVLLQRDTGKQTPLPSEPAIAPDRQRLATADFCESRCENRLVVWRISPTGVVREAEWRPPQPWADAAVRWQDATTLVVEYTLPGASESRTLERKLGDPGWAALVR